MATKMTLLLLSILFSASPMFISDAAPIVSDPQAFPSFDLNFIQLPNKKESCPYTVTIATSCHSPPSTGDRISIVFGDDYGNQVYAPRLDAVAAGTEPEALFEKCSSDTFQIKGPCASQICYIYLYRTGPYGWVPETIEIHAEGAKAVKFDFNKTVPEGKWYGHNFCNNTGSPPPHFPPFTPSVPSPPGLPPPRPSGAPGDGASKLVVTVLLAGAAMVV